MFVMEALYFSLYMSYIFKNVIRKNSPLSHLYQPNKVQTSLASLRECRLCIPAVSWLFNYAMIHRVLI